MWALIILKFKVDFSKFQPTPTLDYTLKIIISSCSIILIMNSTMKMRSLPILANANHMMVVEEKLLTHIKLHINSYKTPTCFGKTFRSDNFRTLVQLSGTFWAPPSRRYFHALPFIDFLNPCGLFWHPYCLLLGTRKYGVPWLLFEWVPYFYQKYFRNETLD